MTPAPVTPEEIGIYESVYADGEDQQARMILRLYRAIRQAWVERDAARGLRRSFPEKGVTLCK